MTQFLKFHEQILSCRGGDDEEFGEATSGGNGATAEAGELMVPVITIRSWQDNTPARRS